VRTSICDLLEIDFPLLAFSHCRDVVAAVTNAGGFGVLGATTFSPAQLEQELTWLDEHVAGRPYGVDILVPEKLVGKGEKLTHADLLAKVPEAHRAFVRDLLARHDLEMTSVADDFLAMDTQFETGEQLLDVAFRHPIKLIASALGVAPGYMLEKGKAEGVPVAALVGAREHAIKQVQAGVDIIVAQGTEAGGHCGEVATMVLVPEVVAAIRPYREVPVLAAGGIVTGRQVAASIALGAAGAWTGSVWLTTEEAETAPATVQKMLAATSRDAVRSSGRTGKPARQLRSAWTEAWDAPASPNALPMPLQSLLSGRLLRRIDVLAEGGHPGAHDLATYFVGQGVGLLNKSSRAGEVVREMIEDYLDAVERLNTSLDA
jgi:NAD(P)H-dependent flavin oxidoreductase YrpB (nitropropane dioxygenase family)